MFVDDTFVIPQQVQKQAFLDHINSIDQSIKFTVEGIQGKGVILLLDTLVTPEADNFLSITVYSKPIHTDQYLQWDSHHNLSAKYSVKGTLTHRAITVCTRPELFQKEIQHLRDTLIRCWYPNWAINRVQSKYNNSNWEDNTNHNNQEDITTQGIHNASVSTEESSALWIITTLHKKPISQVKAQKKDPYQAKIQHRSHGYPLHPRSSRKF